MSASNPVRRIGSPVDIFVMQYREAAGDGAVLELKMRLLASKVPALRPFTDEKLEDVETEIIRLFADHLSATQCDQLRLCRQLRNKVLHCDFAKARKKLHELGAPQVRGGVRQIELTDDTGPGIIQHLNRSMADEPGAHEHVADMNSTADAGVFGWLLELASAGDFLRAAEIFCAASAIIDRLLVVSDQLDES